MAREEKYDLNPDITSHYDSMERGFCTELAKATNKSTGTISRYLHLERYSIPRDLAHAIALAWKRRDPTFDISMLIHPKHLTPRNSEANKRYAVDWRISHELHALKEIPAWHGRRFQETLAGRLESEFVIPLKDTLRMIVRDVRRGAFKSTREVREACLPLRDLDNDAHRRVCPEEGGIHDARYPIHFQVGDLAFDEHFVALEKEHGPVSVRKNALHWAQLIEGVHGDLLGHHRLIARSLKTGTPKLESGVVHQSCEHHVKLTVSPPVTFKALEDLRRAYPLVFCEGAGKTLQHVGNSPSTTRDIARAARSVR